MIQIGDVWLHDGCRPRQLMQSLDAELLRLEGLEDPMSVRAPIRPKLPTAKPETLPEDLPGQVVEEKDKVEVPLTGAWFGMKDPIKQGPKKITCQNLDQQSDQ